MNLSNAGYLLLVIAIFTGSACAGDVGSGQSVANNGTNTCDFEDLDENWKIYKAMNGHLVKGARVNIKYFPATPQPPLPERVVVSGNLKADIWDPPSCQGSVAVLTGKVKVDDCEHMITLSQDNNDNGNWPADCKDLGQDEQECLDEGFTKHLVIRIRQIDVKPECELLHNTGGHLVGDHGSTAHGGDGSD